MTGMSSRWTSVGASLFAATLALSALLSRTQAAEETAPPFPWKKGATWTYSAKVEYTPDGQPEEVKKASLTYTSEIIDTIEGDGLRAARFRGWVTDLAWYEPGKAPSEIILVQVGSNHVFLVSDDIPEIWKALQNKNSEAYADALTDEGMFLDLPLTLGARWGEVPQTLRGMYCSVVTSVDPFDPKSIKGAPTLTAPQEFSILYKTNPDYAMTQYVPGLGITTYEYHHHGTVSNAWVTLVSFKP